MHFCLTGICGVKRARSFRVSGSISELCIQIQKMLNVIKLCKQFHYENENENELYWPGMFTHTRNLL